MITLKWRFLLHGDTCGESDALARNMVVRPVTFASLRLELIISFDLLIDEVGYYFVNRRLRRFKHLPAGG